MPDKGKLVQEWLKKGENDFITAKLAFGASGPTDTIVFLIHQAVEKYLKGYLIGHGWKLIKTHDLELLIGEAITHDREFDQFLDLARKLSGIYFRSRYPPGLPIEFPREEIFSMLEQTQKLITLIKEETR